MKIVEATVQPFELSLRRQMHTATGRVSTRRGFLVRLTDDAGNVGYGEASPAEWLDTESFDEAQSVLADVDTLQGMTVEELGSIVDGWSQRSAAAACGLDTARLDVETKSRGLLLTELLGGRSRSMFVSALVTGRTAHDVAGVARELVDGGYACLKLKVGVESLAVDEERLAVLRREGGDDLAIRLDANRAWTIDDAHRALDAFARYRPDFIEEPCRSGTNVRELERLRREHGVPLALDETAVTIADIEPYVSVADVVIVKAARVGGPTASMLLGTAAKRLGMRPIVTDSIESSVGRAVAIHLAAALHDGDDAVGLGGAVLLREDPLPLMPATRATVLPMGPGLGL